MAELLSPLLPLSLCRAMQHCMSSTQSDCRGNIPMSLQSCSSPPLCACLSGSWSSWSLARRRHSLLACGSSCPPSCWLSLCPFYLTPCTLWLQSGEWASPVHTCCHGECWVAMVSMGCHGVWVTMVSMGCHGEWVAMVSNGCYRKTMEANKHYIESLLSVLKDERSCSSPS